jgi:hypothetical protein
MSGLRYAFFASVSGNLGIANHSPLPFHHERENLADFRDFLAKTPREIKFVFEYGFYFY